MKIGILRLYCGKSGTAGYYNIQEIGIAKEYARNGHTVDIFLLNNSLRDIEKMSIAERITLVSLPCKRIGNHGIFDLSVLKRRYIQLLQINGDNQLYLSRVLNYCKKNSIASYCYMGVLKSDNSNKFKRLIMDGITEFNFHSLVNTTIFVKTPTVLMQLNRKGLDGILAPVGLDSSIIPNIPTNDNLRDELGYTRSEKILLFVGRMEAYKSPLSAIDVITRLPQDYNLLMIGSGGMTNAVKKAVSENKLEERVRVIERIPNAEIHRYYRMCNALLNFNKHEIFGMSILEAMYQECAVIAMHAPGPDYIIENGINGWVVENIEEMVKRIEQVTPEMGEKAKKRVEEYFNWSRMFEQVKDTMANRGIRL